MKRKMFLILAACALWMVPRGAGAIPEDVTRTKHNLSVSGPGPIRATTEKEICVFCHTPHNANPKVPLWNHAPSAAGNYTPYESLTLDAAVGQPDGASKLCLGCHDGTVAVGLTGSRGEIEMIGAGGAASSRPGPPISRRIFPTITRFPSLPIRSGTPRFASHPRATRCTWTTMARCSAPPVTTRTPSRARCSSSAIHPVARSASPAT